MLNVFDSGDGRLRTDLTDSGNAFVLAEKTAKGVLLSKFSVDGELLDQIYSRKGEGVENLKAYLGSEEFVVKKVEGYMHVVVNAECDSCKSRSIKRELDLVESNKIIDVPVVPLFVCIKCKKKFYSMSNPYLTKLVKSNLDLFELDEAKKKDADEKTFVNELKENIIRIFASKRITLIRVSK